MHEIIRTLRDDHANMDKLLRVLDAQLAEFRRGGAPDYDLMLAIMDYMLEYPAQVHHPKENLVYARLAARDSSRADLVDSLLAEHVEVDRIDREFAEALRNVAYAEAEMPRAAFEKRAENYLAAQRRHIERENAEAFPLAERLLEDSDWRAIDAELAAEDPLFGREVADRYKDLAARLLANG